MAVSSPSAVDALAGQRAVGGDSHFPASENADTLPPATKIQLVSASGNNELQMTPAPGPDADPDNVDVSDIGLSDLLHWMQPADRYAYLFGCFNAVFFGFLQPAMVYYLGEVFDASATAGSDPPRNEAFADRILEILWIWGVISVLNWVTAMFYMWSFEWATARQLYKIRTEYFETTLYHSCAWFDAKDPLTVPSRLQVDMRKIKEALGSKMAMAVMNTAQFFAGILFGFVVNAELTAVCCILLPLMVYSTYLFASALTGYSKWMAKFYVGSGALAEEVFSAVKTVIANGGEELEYDRYRKLLLPARAGKARVATRYGFQLGCMDASCFLIYGLCFWYASKLIAGGDGSSGENGLNFDGQGGGRLDGADVLKVVFNIVIGAFGLGQVAPAIQAYAEAKPALKNMKIMREEWLEMKAQQGASACRSGAGGGSGSTNKVADGPLAGGGLNPVASLPSGGVSQQKNSDGSGNGYAVEATDVCFTYPARPDVQVLKSVSFKIAEGSKVAFVGESGSGKSTIIQLIERFYDVDDNNRNGFLGAAAAAGALGQMWVSGRPVTEYPSLDELRRQIGYVQQEPVLFECTIRENLLYGCDSRASEKMPSEADVIAACKQAQIWELIESLPDKLDTRPGSGGSQLSGGQKQRIAIARALVRKPKILLLDEATSSLDTVSEREVQQTIDGLSAVVGGGGGGASVSTTAAPSSSGGKLTVIMVAHRLSTVRNCDKIFFLNRGEILEEGSHDELVAMKGGYYKLTETQAMYDSLAEFARANSKEGGARVLTEGQESPIVVDLPSAVDGAVNGGFPPPGAGGSAQELAPVERQNSKDSKGSKGSKENNMKDGKAPDGAVPAVLKSAEEREEERVNEIAKTYSVPFRRLFSLSTGSELMFYPVGFCFSLVNGAMQPTMMWLMMDAIEHLYNPDHAKMKEGVNEFAWQAVGLAFCLITCFTMSHTCYGYVGSWMTYRARCLVFKTYLLQDMSFFDEPEHAPGRLTALLEKQSADLGFLAGESLGSKCEMLSSIALGLTFAFVASWKLALVVLAALPLLMASMVLMMVALVGSMEEVTTDSPEVVASGNVIAEAVLAIKTVKALTCETDFLKKFDAMVLAISKKESKKAMWTGIAFGFSNGVMGLIFIVCFWYGAELVKEGLSPTDMFKAVMCIFFAGMAAGQAAATVPNTARALAAAHDMFALVDRVPLVDNTEEGNLRDKTDLGLGRGGGDVVTTSSTARTGDRNAELLGVAFDKVKFAYPQRAELPVLKLEDQILRMNCGGAASKSVALAGPSGSGKSTVMALLQRFYDPDAGKVLIDTDRGLKPSEDEGRDAAAAPRGLDLKDANIRRWRDSCGYVGQEPVLFNLSARENILYGMGSEERAKLVGLGAGVAGSTKNKEDELLASVSQQCNIDFVGGPNQLGWDEKLGPRGNRISGGQKQRIAIARALVRRPIVLMLDEATSSLDAVSEKEVQAALEKISGPKLTVTIAHRLSTIANCDNIIVMNDGKILEEGSHAELLEKQGLYFKLVQTSGRKSGTM